MKNLRKLSRIDLKDAFGGRLNTNIEILDDGQYCWVYERNSLQGNATDYKGGGEGTKCANAPAGYHCKTYYASRSC